MKFTHKIKVVLGFLAIMTAFSSLVGLHAEPQYSFSCLASNFGIPSAITGSVSGGFNIAGGGQYMGSDGAGGSIFSYPINPSVAFNLNGRSTYLSQLVATAGVGIPTGRLLTRVSNYGAVTVTGFYFNGWAQAFNVNLGVSLGSQFNALHIAEYGVKPYRGIIGTYQSYLSQCQITFNHP